MYCNNCGNFGHLYRNCKLPVLSYGILTFRNDLDESKLLMIQRKDSLCYIEFIRGKYTIENLEYVKVLLSNCSKDELHKLKTMDFDALWIDLWTKKETLNERTKKEYSKSKDTFSVLINEHNLYDMIDATATNYENPEWEFPKGRRNNQEYNKDCAIREFKEETGVSYTDINLIQNISPVIEEYYGTNGVRYRHVYYISEYIGSKQDHTVDDQCYEQYSEIKDIQWLTKKECLQKIREKNQTKCKIIENIFEFIENYKNDFILINK